MTRTASPPPCYSPLEICTVKHTVLTVSLGLCRATWGHVTGRISTQISDLRGTDVNPDDHTNAEAFDAAVKTSTLGWMLA